VESALEATWPLIELAGHDLKVAIPEEPIHLHADPHRMTQALSNLLNNAAKYTPEGGAIWVTAKIHEGEVVIAVKDSGVGIRADKLELIFEMFTRTGPPMHGDQGLGIGLTLVKSLVEMHGGTIEARSEGPGKGSVFTIRVPYAKPVEETQSDEQESAPTATPALRILIVDDNQAAAEMLSLVVERALGHETRTAHDGIEAIEVAAYFLPDVVLMDLGMPNMNGYEAARLIRQQPWGAEMILIAITGWGQEEDKQRSKAAGFNAHLVKPVEAGELQKLFATVFDAED
jgi:CheY-like chemotaxis protein